MNSIRLLAAWLLLCTVWSSTWIFIKLGLADLPPMLFAGMRFVIASAVLIVINLARKAAWPRTGKEWAFVAVTGWMTFSINYGLLFWGEKQITSGLAAVLQATIPAFGLVFAHFYLPSERLTVPKVAGVALGLVGIGVIFADQLQLSGHLALLGSLAVVVGAGSAAYASVLVKAYARHLDPAVLAGGADVFRLDTARGAGLEPGGQPMAISLDAASGLRAVLSRAGRLVAGVLPVLLVGAADGCHQDHAHFPRDPGSGHLHRVDRSLRKPPHSHARRPACACWRGWDW